MARFDWSKRAKQFPVNLCGKFVCQYSGKQTSEHLVSSFPLSDFNILSSVLVCYFSGTSCTFHFRQMLNGFLTSIFDFYLSVSLQISCAEVKLLEGRYLFPVASDYFIKKLTSVVFYGDQLAHLLVCLVC